MPAGAPGAAGSGAVAVEEPLEIRVRGTPVAVLLRLPGREADLVAGFLAGERVISRPEDLLGVEPCLDPETGRPEPNVWNAALAEGVAFDPRRRRFGYVSSSCGLCGVTALGELQRQVPPLPAGPAEISAAFLTRAFERLHREQPVFRRTSGTHAAALVRPGGDWLDTAEDVGRHNAVDKVLGARLRGDDYPLLQPCVLLVSGRVAFEIVQKAALAGVAAVAGVGVPTHLALDAAAAFGQSLFGLVRDGGATAYAGPTRLRS